MPFQPHGDYDISITENSFISGLGELGAKT
jgi:hypothetical protein